MRRPTNPPPSQQQLSQPSMSGSGFRHWRPLDFVVLTLVCMLCLALLYALRTGLAYSLMPKPAIGSQPAIRELAGPGERPLLALQAIRRRKRSTFDPHPNATNFLGNTRLMEALLADDPHQAGTWLDQGTDPNIANRKGHTPLMIAVRRGRIALVRRILDKKANVNHAAQFGYTALMETRDPKMAQLLLENGADPNATLSTGTSVLMLAAKDGSPGLVRLLLRHGARINTRNQYKETALVWARSEPVFNLLLEQGADYRVSDRHEHTALSLAAGRGMLAAVNMLLWKGADPNRRDKDRETPLMRAVARGHLQVVKALIRNGADVNAANEFKETALMWAPTAGLVRVLIEAGAKINARSDYGMTALMMHCRHERAKIVRLLINNGAKLNVNSDYWGTALIIACRHNNPHVARLLLEAGANINSSWIKILPDNAIAMRAIDVARTNRSPEMIALLKRYEAKKKVREKHQKKKRSL